MLGNQISLFNEAEAEQNLKAPEPTEKTLVAAHERKRKSSNEEKTANLPVRDIILGLKEDQLVCEKCGGKLREIGKILA